MREVGWGSGVMCECCSTAVWEDGLVMEVRQLPGSHTYPPGAKYKIKDDCCYTSTDSNFHGAASVYNVEGRSISLYG